MYIYKYETFLREPSMNHRRYMHGISTMLTRGLILLESLPSLFIASRIQAKSTTAGTPVKSCGIEIARKITHHLQSHRQNHNLHSEQNSLKNLEENTGRLERNFDLLRGTIFPVKNLLNIFLLNLEIVTITQGRLQENSNRIRQPICNTHINTIALVISTN